MELVSSVLFFIDAARSLDGKGTIRLLAWSKSSCCSPRLRRVFGELEEKTERKTLKLMHIL